MSKTHNPWKNVTRVKPTLNPLLNNKPVSKKVLEDTKRSQEKAAYNKKTYSKEHRELRFLVETKKADSFTIKMYVAIISGRYLIHVVHFIISSKHP